MPDSRFVESLEPRQLLSTDPNIVVAEQLANSTTANDQIAVATTSLYDGNLLIAWESYGQDGDTFSEGNIYARIVDTNGNEVAGEFRINDGDNGTQNGVALAALPGGGFVAAWASLGEFGEGPTDGNVYYRLFDSSGNPLTSDRAGSSSTSGSQVTPDIAADLNGNIALVFDDDGDIVLRRIDASGAPLAGNQRVSQSGSNNANPTVQMSYDLEDDAAIGIAWERGSSGNRDVYGRGIGADGSALSDEFIVNTTTAGDQIAPDVAFSPNGEFLIVFQSDTGDANGDQILGRLFTEDGAPNGNDFVINTRDTGNQLRPSATSNIDGRYLVVWDGPGPDGSGVQGNVIDGDGTIADPEIRISSTSGQGQSFASASIGLSGTGVIAWESYDQEGDGAGIYLATLDARPEDPAGVSRGTHQWIGYITGSKTRFGYLGYTDPVDFMRFRITERTQLRFRLSQVTGTTIIQIQKSNGAVLRQEALVDVESRAFRRWMSPGSYYIRLSSLEPMIANYKINIFPTAFASQPPAPTPAALPSFTTAFSDTLIESDYHIVDELFANENQLL